jgi:hypothetical protein
MDKSQVLPLWSRARWHLFDYFAATVPGARLIASELQRMRKELGK